MPIGRIAEIRVVGGVVTTLIDLTKRGPVSECDIVCGDDEEFECVNVPQSAHRVFLYPTGHYGVYLRVWIDCQPYPEGNGYCIMLRHFAGIEFGTIPPFEKLDGLEAAINGPDMVDFLISIGAILLPHRSVMYGGMMYLVCDLFKPFFANLRNNIVC